jgi:hypothetical protein
MNSHISYFRFLNIQKLNKKIICSLITVTKLYCHIFICYLATTNVINLFIANLTILTLFYHAYGMLIKCINIEFEFHVCKVVYLSFTGIY